MTKLTVLKGGNTNVKGEKVVLEDVHLGGAKKKISRFEGCAILLEQGKNPKNVKCQGDHVYHIIEEELGDYTTLEEGYIAQLDEDRNLIFLCRKEASDSEALALYDGKNPIHENSLGKTLILAVDRDLGIYLSLVNDDLKYFLNKSVMIDGTVYMNVKDDKEDNE